MMRLAMLIVLTPVMTGCAALRHYRFGIGFARGMEHGVRPEYPSAWWSGYHIGYQAGKNQRRLNLLQEQ